MEDPPTQLLSKPAVSFRQFVLNSHPVYLFNIARYRNDIAGLPEYLNSMGELTAYDHDDWLANPDLACFDDLRREWSETRSIWKPKKGALEEAAFRHFLNLLPPYPIHVGGCKRKPRFSGEFRNTHRTKPLPLATGSSLDRCIRGAFLSPRRPLAKDAICASISRATRARWIWRLKTSHSHCLPSWFSKLPAATERVIATVGFLQYRFQCCRRPLFRMASKSSTPKRATPTELHMRC